MREYLFRGKRKDTGEWVYGYVYAHNKNKTFRIMPVQPDKDWNFHDDEVDPETVGQYTGLRDSTKWESLTSRQQEDWLSSGKTKEEWDGVKIFEGDVIRDTLGGSIAFIIFAHARFMSSRTLDPNDICIGVTRWGDCEVIGNIHDNPEFLEVVE